jgi:hypothetical protein
MQVDDFYVKDLRGKQASEVLMALTFTGTLLCAQNLHGCIRALQESRD